MSSLKISDVCNFLYELSRFRGWIHAMKIKKVNNLISININKTWIHIHVCTLNCLLGLWLMLVGGSRVFLPSGNQWLFWSNPFNLDIYADAYFLAKHQSSGSRSFLFMKSSVSFWNIGTCLCEFHSCLGGFTQQCGFSAANYMNRNMCNVKSTIIQLYNCTMYI